MPGARIFPRHAQHRSHRVTASDRVYDLPTMVSKFMAIDVDMDKAIQMVTSNAARVFDFGEEIGTLKPGNGADISIFELREGRFDFEDSDGKKRSGRDEHRRRAARRATGKRPRRCRVPMLASHSRNLSRPTISSDCRRRRIPTPAAQQCNTERQAGIGPPQDHLLRLDPDAAGPKCDLRDRLRSR